MKPVWYTTSSHILTNLNHFLHIQFAAPNTEGYCQIRGFKESVPDFSVPDTDLPDFTIIGWCAKDDVDTFRENIINMT